MSQDNQYNQVYTQPEPNCNPSYQNTNIACQQNEKLIRFEHEEAKANMDKASMRLFLWFPFGICQYIRAKRRLREATEKLREFLQN